MGARLAYQGFNCQIVLDVAIAVDQPVLAVGRERIQGHIGDDAQVRKLRFDRAHGPLRDAVRVPGFPGIQRFLFFRRDRKQGDGRDFELHQGGAFTQQFVDRHPLDARHRCNGLPLILAFDHEKRINQGVDAELRLAHQTAGELVAPHAAQPGMRK